jgi:hypothetical protein
MSKHPTVRNGPSHTNSIKRVQRLLSTMSRGLDQDNMEVSCRLHDHRDGEVLDTKNSTRGRRVVQHRDEFTRAQVLAINRCRVYLQVISLSDMTSNDGIFLLKSYYLGTEDPTRHWLRWPRQMKPRKQDWEQWRRDLKMFFGTVTTML